MRGTFLIQTDCHLRMNCRPTGRFRSSGCDRSYALGGRESHFEVNAVGAGLYPAIGAYLQLPMVGALNSGRRHREARLLNNRDKV